MNELMEELLCIDGVSGYEFSVGKIIRRELNKNVNIKTILYPNGNVLGALYPVKQMGISSDKTSIALLSHMDEIGLMVRYIDEKGFIYFSKIGGISDLILPTQRVIIKSSFGTDVVGIIGTKSTHLMTDEEEKQAIKHKDMFIDIGCSNREETLKRVKLGDSIVFEPNRGFLNNDLYFGKSVDNRIGCYIMLQVMNKMSSAVSQCQLNNLCVFGVATVQEEVGLKGAKMALFQSKIDMAIIIDTTTAGDTPNIEEKDCNIKLGGGVAITFMEGAGEGTITDKRLRDILIKVAEENKIKYQLDLTDGGWTDGYYTSIGNGGIPTLVVSIPTRYLHTASSVFNMKDVEACIELITKFLCYLDKNNA